MACSFEHDSEELVILDELDEPDDYPPRPLVGHHAFNLTHLVQPERAQVRVDGSPRLTPELERPLSLAVALLHLEQRRVKRGMLIERAGVAHEDETLTERHVTCRCFHLVQTSSR
ncbi:MAG: hypothetical protein ACLQVI_24610 [Polyangiaceae bacterium]